ncbi:MAG: ABC transporter substrate-binding protein [Armatimonadetes bacterium]|nr:ABC transporter substrate-binding protein [Armatimonadota bacterium]
MTVLTRMLAIAVVVALTSAVASFNVASAQADPRPELKVRLWFSRPGGIFDPHRWRYTSDWFVYPSLFNWLVRWKPGTGGNVLEPDLAERWTASDDGTVYTFHLRKGVQFHRDLGEMTAEDVVFSFKRQIDDPRMSFHSQVQRQIAAVEAMDRYTVRIRLKEPNAAFISTLVAFRQGFIVSKKAAEQMGADFAKTPVGTGPFMLERVATGREVVVTAHDRYFRGRPAVRRITYAHIPDEVVAATALIKGEFHIIWTRANPEAVRLLQQASGVKTERVIVYDSLRHVAISPNFKPTQDVRVRRALSYAINRQQIGAALPGLELPTDIIRPGRLFGGSSNVSRYPYSPAKAKELLAQAGYAGGFRVRILLETNTYQEILASVVQANWRDAGIDAVLDPLESNAAFDKRNKLDFDVSINSVGRPADPDLFFSDFFWSAAKPPGGQNFFGYSAVDDLILAGRREQNRAKRQLIYEQINQKLMSDLPALPLTNQIFVSAWRAPVTQVINGVNNNFWAETIKVQQ